VGKPKLTGDEGIILLIIWRSTVSYGAEINRQIEKLTGRRLDRTALYGSLHRLRRRKFVHSELRSGPHRGPIRIRLYRLEFEGEHALKENLFDLRFLVSMLKPKILTFITDNGGN